MKRAAIIIVVAAALLAPALAWANRVRVKDFADFNGVRDNQLVGIGLVVGLPTPGCTPGV